MAQEDWLRVILVKEGNEPEAMPVTFVADMGDYQIGILEMEPEQDFGYHKGEKIGYFPYTDDNGKTVLISDMNPSAKITEADLEDGSMLEAAVTRFNAERNEPNFLELLEILRDSYVWVPCTAIMSDEDQKRFEELIDSLDGNLDQLKGTEFVAHDQTRLVPDILQNGDNFFFPIFSTAEAMGEYGDNFSKVQKHILEVIPLARNNEKEPVGIVLNAFSEVFVLDKEIWDIVENMKSRISE